VIERLAPASLLHAPQCGEKTVTGFIHQRLRCFTHPDQRLAEMSGFGDALGRKRDNRASSILLVEARPDKSLSLELLDPIDDERVRLT